METYSNPNKNCNKVNAKTVKTHIENNPKSKIKTVQILIKMIQT